MSRIDDYLDGALERAALTPQERIEADAVDSAIEATRRYITERPAPDVSAGVMRYIDESKPRRGITGAISALVGALWTARPVSLRIRPAYALLGLAAVVAAIINLPVGGPSPTATDASRIAAEPQLFVQFRLQAAEASDVRLAGSFTNWQPDHQLHQAAPGIWTITVALSPGVHDYAFIVDGERWLADPYAQQVNDGFGGANNRIVLVTPTRPRT